MLLAPGQNRTARCSVCAIDVVIVCHTAQKVFTTWPSVKESAHEDWQVDTRMERHMHISKHVHIHACNCPRQYEYKFENMAPGTAQLVSDEGMQRSIAIGSTEVLPQNWRLSSRT